MTLSLKKYTKVEIKYDLIKDLYISNLVVLLFYIFINI